MGIILPTIRTRRRVLRLYHSGVTGFDIIFTEILEIQAEIFVAGDRAQIGQKLVKFRQSWTQKPGFFTDKKPGFLGIGK
ncbi:MULTISPECIES: hypothetical protein [unclassified Microcoleus]|uniref:hypothetical protein n=1 Tax=unclassified Microcoleus TaxID=2642155 RepID=UPI002FD50ABE